LLADNNFNFSNIDILKDIHKIEKHIEECDVVFPLAAIANPSVYVTKPLSVFELDFEANLAIIKIALKYKKRLIFPSTSEVYGMCTDEAFDEETSNCTTGPICKQRWIYSCSKQMLDRVIYAYGISDNFQYTLFRPFNLIGTRLDDMFNATTEGQRVVTQFISNIYHQKHINLVDGGNQKRCFLDIADAVQALIKIIENENGCADQQIFNIGNPYNELSIKDLAYQIVDLAKGYDKLKNFAEKVEIRSVDAKEYYGKSYQDVARRSPSISKAQRLLNWNPVISMRESLTKIMDFYFVCS
jgi:nucleoside-diphosphate-sugar epimerase